MMKSFDLEKFGRTISVTIGRRSKADADDTLHEKLYTVIEQQPLTGEQISVLLESIEEIITSSIDTINTVPALRIGGILIKTAQRFDGQSRFASFLSASVKSLMINRNYSFQSAYFKSLNDIATVPNACQWLLTSSIQHESFKSFPELIFHFLTQNQSFFVQQEVIKLLAHLMEVVLCANQQQNIKSFAGLLNPLLCKMKPDHCNLMKRLLTACSSVAIRHKVAQDYAVTETLLIELDRCLVDHSDTVWLVCDLLGCCVDRNETIDLIEQKLSEKNDLKGLIAFFTSLINCKPSFASKWMVYAVCPLIIQCAERCELLNEFLSTAEPKQIIEKWTNKEIIEFSMKQILNVNRDFLIHEKQFAKVICEAIAINIKINVAKSEMKKLISNAFVALDSFASERFIDLVPVLFNLYADLLITVPDDLKCTVLKGIRFLIESHKNPEFFACDSIKKISTHLIESISKIDVLEEDDLIDSLLEVIYSLSCIDSQLFLKTSPNLLVSFFTVWNRFKDNEESQVRASCAPILVHLDLGLPEGEFMKLSMKKHESIPLSLLSYLKEGDVFMKKAILNAFSKENYLFLIDQRNERLFCDYCQALCGVVLNETDDFIQFDALTLLQNLIFSNITSDPKKRLQFWLRVGFFHALFKLLTNDLVVERIFVLAGQITMELRAQIEVFGMQPEDVTKLMEVDKNNASPDVVAFVFNYQQTQDNVDPDKAVLDDIINFVEYSHDMPSDCY